MSLAQHIVIDILHHVNKNEYDGTENGFYGCFRFGKAQQILRHSSIRSDLKFKWYLL